MYKTNWSSAALSGLLDAGRINVLTITVGFMHVKTIVLVCTGPTVYVYVYPKIIVLECTDSTVYCRNN